MSDVYTRALTLVRTYLEEIMVPIFYDLTGPEPEGATGTFFELGDRLFLITAAHVLEDKDITKFSIPLGRKNSHPITLGTVDYQVPASDDLDVAIVELLLPEAIAGFKQHYRCLTLDQIALPTPGARHILAGYPSQMVKLTPSTLDQGAFAYTTEMLAEWPTVEHPRPEWDLFFHLGREGELFDGKVQAVPNLCGTSGCVVWEQAESGPLWTPQGSLKAIGIQSSAMPGAWFRASNSLAIIPVLATFDRAAAAKLAVTLIGPDDPFVQELLRRVDDEPAGPFAASYVDHSDD